LNNRLSILDIWVDPVNRATALGRVKKMLETAHQPCCIFASNPEKNFSVPKDPILYQAYRDAALLLPDGIGMVWAVRVLHGLRISRVPGSEFIFDICRLAEEEERGVFFYGAREAVSQAAVDRLRQRFPRLTIAGRANGYIPETDMPQLVEQINASGAEILFIALGSPRQEKWFATYAGALRHVKVCQGIGGTLDTIAGAVKRAPVFWCRLNLEWFYRLVKEPRRIERQRLLPLFALKVLLEKISRQ
jgi:N-acetylglucosaminyldiphosphoundecaprenol N-acetyl-beta-D-mannosaminyltransferase